MKLFIANYTHIEDGIILCSPGDICRLTDDYHYIGYRKYYGYYNLSKDCIFFIYPKVRRYKPSILFKLLFC